MFQSRFVKTFLEYPNKFQAQFGYFQAYSTFIQMNLSTYSPYNFKWIPKQHVILNNDMLIQ